MDFVHTKCNHNYRCVIVAINFHEIKRQVHFEFTTLLLILRCHSKANGYVEITDSMIKAVLFDLDGVLVSTDEYHYFSWKDSQKKKVSVFFDHEFNHKFRGVAKDGMCGNHYESFRKTLYS